MSRYEAAWIMSVADSPAAAGRSRACGALARFVGYRPAALSLMLLLVLLSVSLLAPLFAPYGRDGIDLDNVLAGPSAEHVAGTDELGRDLLSRLIYGGRFTLLVAVLSVAFAVVLGLILGTASGFLGGPFDAVITGLVELFLSVPVFLILLVAAGCGRGFWVIPLVIGGTSWMETARLVRSETLVLKSEGYVEAARSMGSSSFSLAFKHILPHALAPVIVAATIGFAQAMLIESSLSFLGFGVQPPTPTWGNMLHNAQIFMRRAPTAAFAPGFMIFITCLCFNFVGEGLRRSLDATARN